MHPEETTASNAVRLSGREWLVVLAFGLGIWLLAPALWRKFEHFEPGTDFRLPHALSNDYWLYERAARAASERGDVVVLGDSAIWGRYVPPEESLSSELTRQGGRQRFMNLGVEGMFPVALRGLVACYGKPFSGRTVLFQCNPVWLRNPRVDLEEDEGPQNHTLLWPQFTPRIRLYREETSRRLGNLVDRNTDFGGWTDHLQVAYYDEKSLPFWTYDHPYENPIAPLRRGLQIAADRPDDGDQDWKSRGIGKQADPWVSLETSPQWRAFQETVRLLIARQCRLLILIGPFNEHMLTPASLEKYRRLKASIEAWLKDEAVAFLAPSALPSEEFGDASHPLKAGYQRLAAELLKDPFFK
jgi:hypothetical protein